jgi:hypothetical protein
MLFDEHFPRWFKLGKTMLCLQELLAKQHFHLRGRTRIGDILISNCFKRFERFTDQQRRTLLLFLEKQLRLGLARFHPIVCDVDLHLCLTQFLGHLSFLATRQMR